MRQEIDPFTIVRLDADSTETITDVDGSKTTPAALAQKHNMIYRPGVLVFDGVKLMRRTDSLVFPHHFKEGMRYIAGGFYKNTDYQAYSEAHRGTAVAGYRHRSRPAEELDPEQARQVYYSNPPGG